MAVDQRAGCCACSQAAAEAGVVLVGGSLPERSKGKLYNTCCVFSTTGKLLAKHRCVWVLQRKVLVRDYSSTRLCTLSPSAGAAWRAEQT